MINNKIKMKPGVLQVWFVLKTTVSNSKIIIQWYKVKIQITTLYLNCTQSFNDI